MDKLRTFLNSMTPAAQDDFARRCGTTIGYLRKAISINSRFDVQRCINIDTESGGRVRCEDLRPEVTWEKLRNPIAEAA